MSALSFCKRWARPGAGVGMALSRSMRVGPEDEGLQFLRAEGPGQASEFAEQTAAADLDQGLPMVQGVVQSTGVVGEEVGEAGLQRLLSLLPGKLALLAVTVGHQANALARQAHVTTLA